MFTRAQQFLSPMPETTPFQALIEIGLRAFQSANYGAQECKNIAELLSQSGWVEKPNRAEDCRVGCGVLSVFSDFTKHCLVSETQTKQGMVRELDMLKLASEAERHSADSEVGYPLIFGLDDGSLLTLSQFNGGFSFTAFMSDVHTTQAKLLARETTYYDAALRALPDHCTPRFQIGWQTIMKPAPKPDFPTAVKMTTLPKTTLDAGEGAYRTGKDTRWRLAFFDTRMAELLTSQGLAFAPTTFTLSQLQTL